MFKKATKYFPEHPSFLKPDDLDSKLEKKFKKFKGLKIGNNNLDSNLIFFWLDFKYFESQSKKFNVFNLAKVIGNNSSIN